MLESGKAIPERGWMQVFGCKPVVDRDHAEACAIAQFGADIVVALKSANDEAAAMKIEADGFRIDITFFVDAKWDFVIAAVDELVGRRHRLRIAGKECRGTWCRKPPAAGQSKASMASGG